FELDEIRLFLLDQVINTVKSYTAVVAYDTSSSVSIRKTCDDLVVTRFLHFRSIYIKYCLVVCFMIFGKDLMQLRAWSISVSGTSLLCHLDSAVRHERSFQRLVCLQSDNLLQIFHLFIDISRTVCCQAGNNFCLHIQNAAFSALFFLKLLKLSPQFIGCLCRSCQEGFISFILCIVVLDKVTHIDFLFPEFAFEVCPLFKLLHKKFLLLDYESVVLHCCQLFS